MKKYIALIALTGILILGSIITDKAIDKPPEKVKLFTVMPVTANVSINCTGKIEESSKKDVKSEYPLIVQEILVKEGDLVHEGQQIIKIDKELTMQTLASASDIPDAYKAVFSQDDIPEYITAPIDGNILSVAAKPNSIASIGDSLFTLSADTGKRVLVTVNETQFSSIKVGQQVSISGKSFADKKYTGTVKTISENAKQQISTLGSETVIDVFISVDDADDNIKPGFSAKTKILSRQAENVLIVPFSSVNQDENGQEFVYIYNNGWAYRQNVKTRDEFDEGYEIESGIKENDIIVDNVSKHFEKVFKAGI